MSSIFQLQFKTFREKVFIRPSLVFRRASPNRVNEIARNGHNLTNYLQKSIFDKQHRQNLLVLSNYNLNNSIWECEMDKFYFSPDIWTNCTLINRWVNAYSRRKFTRYHFWRENPVGPKKNLAYSKYHLNRDYFDSAERTRDEVLYPIQKNSVSFFKKKSVEDQSTPSLIFN